MPELAMPERHPESARFCSRCGHAITVPKASFCKECGAPLLDPPPLDDAILWHPLTALMLSVVPGLGHWYKGLHRRGVIWFLGVMFLYASAHPIGFLMHLICAANAAWGSTRPRRQPGFRRRSRRLRAGSVQQF
ncbi:MAG TPA: hypothetical protein VKS22_07140 [Candidatus Binataceae bacterium]|nr:hypothetical protein [Candidatus Binataceae bacterium]